MSEESIEALVSMDPCRISEPLFLASEDAWLSFLTETALAPAALLYAIKADGILVLTFDGFKSCRRDVPSVLALCWLALLLLSCMV